MCHREMTITTSKKLKTAKVWDLPAVGPGVSYPYLGHATVCIYDICFWLFLMGLTVCNSKAVGYMSNQYLWHWHCVTCRKLLRWGSDLIHCCYLLRQGKESVYTVSPNGEESTKEASSPPKSNHFLLWTCQNPLKNASKSIQTIWYTKETQTDNLLLEQL